MIIRHLVHAGAGDLLKTAFVGRFNWPEVVQSELHVQAHGRYPIPGLASFLDTCGRKVIALTDEEIQEAEDIQLEMTTRAELAANPKKNLGEAQCLVACDNDRTLVFASQDGRGRSRARTTHPPITLFGLLEVIYLFVRLGLCKPGQAWKLYELCVGTGFDELRGFPVSEASSKKRFIDAAAVLCALWMAEQAPSGPPQRATS
jgi:hypothetical protein